MRYRCAVLDDYQNVALTMADWARVTGDADVTVFNERLGDEAAVARALQGFGIVCLMRERTPFPRSLIEKLPDLKLIVTTGLKNAAIDIAAAKDRGILVCGTEGAKHPTAELAIGLMIDLARHISEENARMKAGEAWQATVGADLFGHTLGLIGLGNLGQRVAKVAQAFGMNVIAWSQNLTPDRCKEHGVAYATKADLFQQSDFISIHMVLSDRSRGLVSKTDLGMMKPTAYIINTSRGPIIDEAALIAALQNKTIAGAGLDVFDTEPLPRDHALRKLPNVVITPHLGYVTRDGYRAFYGGTVEAIRAFLDRKPIRVIG
jgi:phosphoglycerate dehydrogenase-like enzyme